LAKGLSAIANCKKMVAKNLSVNVIGCPIHRESNNLAMSSRNERSSRRKSRSGSHLQNTSRSKEKFATNSISAVSEWQNVSRQSSL
jgi:pantoate--beta-alanine ligase